MATRIPVQSNDSNSIAGYITPGGNGTCDASIVVRYYTPSGAPDGCREREIGTFSSCEAAEFEVRYREWVERGCPVLTD